MIAPFCQARKLPVLALLVITMTVLFTACGETSNASVTPTPTPAKITATAHAILQHMPSGSVTLSWDPVTKKVAVKLVMTGLVPNSLHPTHIHSGSCSTPGRLIYPLENTVADAKGNAIINSTVANVPNGIPATGWLIYIHNGPYVTSDAQSLPISCGDVANPNGAKVVQAKMTGTTERDQSASGTAQLTLRGQQLTLALTISGLQPGSTHPARIHSGSCSSQGSVVYTLRNVVANAAGKATMTAIIENVSSIPSSGWYLDVNYSQDLSTQAGADSIVCGNILSD